MITIANRKRLLISAFCAVAFGRAWAQAPQMVILDIEFENGVVYFGDVADSSKFATVPAPASASIRTFEPIIIIDDIVSVNGRPAKGSVVSSGRLTSLSSNPMPGQAIGDIGRGGLGETHLEIMGADGTRIGSIMTSGFGFGGPAPPGAPAGVFSNQAVVGGTGAYLGARGMLVNPSITHRTTSMAEDPANRRTNGGGRGHYIVYLIPLSLPKIASTTGGPAVVHAGDGNLVTGSNPAKSGEVLTLYATGLGPTQPALEPGKAFTANPLQVANSPIEVSVGGQTAEVLYAGGYPGTNDAFQVNFRVPSGVPPGTAILQIAAAFISQRAGKYSDRVARRPCRSPLPAWQRWGSRFSHAGSPKAHGVSAGVACGQRGWRSGSDGRPLIKAGARMPPYARARRIEGCPNPSERSRRRIRPRRVHGAEPERSGTSKVLKSRFRGTGICHCAQRRFVNRGARRSLALFTGVAEPLEPRRTERFRECRIRHQLDPQHRLGRGVG